MSQPIRVLVVGTGRAVRAWLDEQPRASGFEVIGEVPAIGEASMPDEADVVLVGDDRLLRELLDASPERSLPALVVVGRGPHLAATLRISGAPGWAVVLPTASASELAAAIAAAWRGFAVQPAATGHDVADEDEHAYLEALTPREREVLQLASQGLGNKAIAGHLGISDHTVKFHLSSIFGKLGASSRTEAVRRGVQAGWIEI